MSFWKSNKRIISLFLLLALIYLLIDSLDISLKSIIYEVDIAQIVTDLIATFLRVTLSSFLAWSGGMIVGYLFYKYKIVENILIDVVNFSRHISPFALLPFAIIWFGLGEIPLYFILIFALFFPCLIASSDIFRQIPRSYIEEAQVLGCNNFSSLIHVEFPMAIFPLLNQYRIIWGLGWSTVIAAEMLGVKNGLGSRLLDFRYLLQYPQMIQYLIIMGVVGIIIDKILQKIVLKFDY